MWLGVHVTETRDVTALWPPALWPPNPPAPNAPGSPFSPDGVSGILGFTAMSNPSLSHVEPLNVDGVEFIPKGHAVRIRGKMTSRQPEASIHPYLRRIHDEVCRLKLKEIDIDVTELTFVNSSAIRLFVDWTMWAKGSQDTPLYEIIFHAKEGITWQRMTLTALTSLAPKVVHVRSVP